MKDLAPYKLEEKQNSRTSSLQPGENDGIILFDSEFDSALKQQVSFNFNLQEELIGLVHQALY